MPKYDLHTHSHFSDGALSPTDLVQAAHAAGVDHLALTDHDSVSGIAEAKQAAAELPITIINGVEISTNHRLAHAKRGMSVHVVGLDFDDLEGMDAALQDIQNQRATRARAICERLKNKLGVDMYDDALMLAKANPKAITRSHIAKAMVEAKVVVKYQQAFDKYLAQGKPAYVPIDTIGVADAVKLIHDAKGLAVLAHPTRYNLSATKTRRLIADFAAACGDALELPPKNESPATRAMVDRCTAEHGLAVSVASDFHGAHMPWLRLGDVPSLKEGQTPVWQLFA